MENQILFFVLEILFEKSKDSRKDSQSSLVKLALEFIRHGVEILEEDLNIKIEPKHLFDLVQLIFIRQAPDQPSHPSQENIPLLLD